jgi:hypothetical protein
MFEPIISSKIFEYCINKISEDTLYIDNIINEMVKNNILMLDKIHPKYRQKLFENIVESYKIFSGFISLCTIFKSYK